MIKRFRLDQKSHYERLVIAQRLSEMLTKFLDGRLAPLAIGAEQGGIEEWDDVVIQHTKHSFEHLQVKRQASDFCTKDSDKAKYLAKQVKSGSSNGQLQLIPGPKPPRSNVPFKPKKPPQVNSVLDSAFASLAKHAAKGTFDTLPERQFQLTLVGASMKVKADLTVDHVDALCKLCRQDGLDLNELANITDGPTQRAYTWLTTWCGFQDWAQIRDTLRRVTIVCVGNDAYLEQRCAEALARHFTDPLRALKQLLMYITWGTSHVSTLGCHAVLTVLKSELRPDIETWAQYDLAETSMPTGQSWSLAGTHDLGALTPRSAQGVVEHMWSSDPGIRKLRIYAQYKAPIGANLTLPAALLRMALHLPPGTHGLMRGEPVWRSSVGHEVGHTLGVGESDLIHLAWVDNSERLGCSTNHGFASRSSILAEAQALADAMDNLVWQRVSKSVFEKFSLISDAPLADAMEAMWIRWLKGFENDLDTRRAFLEQLLYPETEGKNAKHALRLGPRTHDLMVGAIQTLLLVAVGVGGTDNEWGHFPDCGKVLSIALKYWSGPAGPAPEVRELSEDPLIEVVGPSPAPVVILAGVNYPPHSC
nr:ABC-three component system protein [Pseudomonas amygdali]